MVIRKLFFLIFLYIISIFLSKNLKYSFFFEKKTSWMYFRGRNILLKIFALNSPCINIGTKATLKKLLRNKYVGKIILLFFILVEFFVFVLKHAVHFRY